MRTELLSVCAAADYSICVILPTSPTALDRPPISDSIPAHIGTYALAERGDEGAHIAGYALPGARFRWRIRLPVVASMRRAAYSQVGSDLRGVVVGILVRGAVIGVGLFSSPTWFCKAAARIGRQVGSLSPGGPRSPSKSSVRSCRNPSAE